MTMLRTTRMTADHSWLKRLGRLFGGAGNCAVLDNTWNVVMAYFLSCCALMCSVKMITSFFILKRV